MRLKTNYAIALANLYGIVHKEKVVEIYNRQNKVQMDLTEIDDIMNQKQAQLNKYFTYINGDYFVQEAIIAFDECDLYLQEQDGKPYYIPKKRELLKYKDEAYFEKTPEYHRLVDFIKKHRQKDSVNSVEDICVDVVMHCQMDDSPNIIINDMNRLGVPLDTQAELAEAVELVAELSNNIRRWENNGFTPSELFEYYAKNDPNHKGKSANRLNQAEEVTIQPIIKGKKIGRNEPCPCGSGKKYKECCL